MLPPRNVLVQVINTDPKYYWVTSFFETALLRAVWYPTTVGTVSWMCKQILRCALSRTSEHPEMVRRYLHDYGARGVSWQQSAALGGLAHLVNFDQRAVRGRAGGQGRSPQPNPASQDPAFAGWGLALSESEDERSEKRSVHPGRLLPRDGLY